MEQSRCLLSLSPDGSRRVFAWLLMGLFSLALSSLFALVLAVARVPGLKFIALPEGFFNTALVLHVNLSATLWFLAFSGALWSLAGGSRRVELDWLALGSALVGAVLLIVSPWVADGNPVLSDYLPTLRNPIFFAGFLCLFASLALAAVRALLTISPWGEGAFGVSGSGLFLAALCAVLALVAFVVSYVQLPLTLVGKDYFNPLYWAGGHLLQFTHLLLMLTVWLILARVAGVEWRLGLQGAESLFLLAALPALLFFIPGMLLAPDQMEHRLFFTNLMSWGSWPVVPVFVGGLVFGCWRCRWPMDDVGRGARAALWGSVFLFVLGLVTGGFIQDDTVMVTAHYHGTVGAVTLAYMGMTIVLLPMLGRVAFPVIVARFQARLYAFGLIVLIAGLGWSGLQGAPRKTPLVAHGADLVRAPEGMALMGGGAAIALVATFLFLLPALRSMLTRAKQREVQGRGFWLTLVLALSVIVVLGGVIHLVPDNATPPPLSATVGENKSVDGDDELLRRFQEGAMMLHAKRYDYALTAFHWVLQRAPNLPEAHVNMGFSLVGLQRYKAARDFFQAAIELRTNQVNAYYGLAMALEGLHDLDGARGAMRTFIHLSPADSAYVRKAESAMWEWENPKP